MDENALILVVEDDDKDALLLQEAFRRAGILNPVEILVNAEQYQERAPLLIVRVTRFPALFFSICISQPWCVRMYTLGKKPARFLRNPDRCYDRL
jgi:hypothetical protein